MDQYKSIIPGWGFLQRPCQQVSGEIGDGTAFSPTELKQAVVQLIFQSDRDPAGLGMRLNRLACHGSERCGAGGVERLAWHGHRRHLQKQRLAGNRGECLQALVAAGRHL